LSLAELLIGLAILALVAALSVPSFLGALRGATIRSGAQHVAAALARGRQLAIRSSERICVRASSTALHYRLGSCEGPVHKGPGTDPAGNIGLPAGLTVSASASPVFDAMGAALPAATFTVHSTSTDQALRVIVAGSGRIRIAP
jgi:Tfp pilus assembly protein FimT